MGGNGRNGITSFLGVYERGWFWGKYIKTCEF